MSERPWNHSQLPAELAHITPFWGLALGSHGLSHNIINSELNPFGTVMIYPNLF